MTATRRATGGCARAGPRPSRPAVTGDAPERAAIDVVPRERVRGIQPTRAVDARRHIERATSFERSPKRLTLRRPAGRYWLLRASYSAYASRIRSRTRSCAVA